MKFSPRMTAAVLAAALAVTTALPAVAQQPSIGPAGGVPSTTAPSNSEGDPAGGTGVLKTTRVGPSGTTAVPSPVTNPTPTTPRRPRRVRNRRPAPRPAAEIGTQSQSGLNGSMPPSK